MNSYLKFYNFNVYGPIKIEEKKNIWDAINREIQSLEMEFIVGGDFNAILDLKEKSGGSRKITHVQKDFGNFIESNNLLDIVPTNGNYTWTNWWKGFANIAERLDRFLLSEQWLLQSIMLNSRILALLISDYFPVELCIPEDVKPSSGQFKFEKMWL